MKRFIPFILYLILIAMHEVIWREMTTLYFVAINLPAMIVVIVAIYKSEVTAAWFGFLAGLVLAAGSAGAMGWQALFLAALGVAVFHAREQLNLDSLNSKLLLVVSAVLVHNIVSVIINDASSFLYMLWSFCLPSAAYTTIAAWVFFLFKERRLTFQKMKSVF